MNILNIKNNILLCLIIIFIYETYFFSSAKIKNNKNIFTFWEPREKIPGYILLCIKTWKKFLPEYQIQILDYEKVKKYLGKELFSQIICKNMTLPIQADAIRVAILKKFGGIWMDADTIILNEELFKRRTIFDLIMVGDEKTKTQNIGFIYASKNSKIINEWLKEIINKVRIYKENMINPILDNLEMHKSWSYLGNNIVNRIITNAKTKEFLRLDRNKLSAMPELNLYKNYSQAQKYKYNLLYFRRGDPKIVLNKAKNIILLHNSWTPFKYKSMSEQEFLSQDILLSKLLSNLLNK